RSICDVFYRGVRQCDAHAAVYQRGAFTFVSDFEGCGAASGYGWNGAGSGGRLLLRRGAGVGAGGFAFGGVQRWFGGTGERVRRRVWDQAAATGGGVRAGITAAGSGGGVDERGGRVGRDARASGRYDGDRGAIAVALR